MEPDEGHPVEQEGNAAQPRGQSVDAVDEVDGIDDENRNENGSPDKPGGLSIQLCKSEKKEFYIRYSS